MRRDTRRIRPARVAPALLALAFSGAGTAFAQSAAPDSLPQWIAAAGDTVLLDLTVRASADAPSALINGYRGGAAEVRVPLHSVVRWTWRSADSSVAHSLVVMVEREKLPERAGRPAFRNALTRSALQGLPAGRVDHTTFVADQQGWFWLLCGVPGHTLRGEWIGLRVDPGARVPGVSFRAPR